MAHWLHRSAARYPDRVAVEGPERALTYRQLAAAAVEVMKGLGGDRGPVAIELPPGESWVVALHGCLLAGRSVQPVDLRLSEAERARRRRGASLVIDGELPRPGTWIRRTTEGQELVAAVMHTSGTTSEPKPVALTAGNFLASALGSAVMLGLDLGERWLCPMPLTHVGGLSIPIRSAIYGTTVVLHGRFETAAVVEELMSPERAITLVSLVPTMLARLLDAGLSHPPRLRWALLGGGPIAPALLARAAAAGVPVAPTYGMTEACSQIATFGWPLPGVELRLQAPGALEGGSGPAQGASGESPEGEVLVRGPIVAPGALAEDGWLHTGDLGRFDRTGRLEIAGRASDTIVTGGENVAPAEVESVLAEHPAVADAAVYARPDDEWGEAVVAAVVLRAGGAVDGAGLREFCQGRLAGFKVPKDFQFVETLPRTASGKLLRRRLARDV